MFHLDRVIFLGEGNYGVRDVKQVKVTESYLGLGPNCQTGQNKADCIIWRHLERILATCHCAPFSLKSYFRTQVRERGREGERERERERDVLNLNLNFELYLKHRTIFCVPRRGPVPLLSWTV